MKIAQRLQCWNVTCRQQLAVVWDLLCPPHCLVCGAELCSGRRKIWICSACRQQIVPASQTWCRRCGQFRPRQPGDYRAEREMACAACQHCKHRFREVLPLGPYEGLRREVVLRIKQPHHQVLAVHLGRLLGRQLRRYGSCPSRSDCVVPVPKHWWRRLARGTNSADLLAEGVSHVVQVPLAGRLLFWRRSVDKQSLLSRSARIRNLRGALGVRKSYDVRGRSILLVDDLMTTGTTANEAARVLQAAGAVSVTVGVVCRA